LNGSGKSSTTRPTIRHNVDEFEDEFEEFESPQFRSVPDLSVDDKVTIWMNSWMDDDDGDFSSSFNKFKRH